MDTDINIFFMQQALLLAKKAERQGEVPVGAVIVQNNQIIARGFNQKEQQQQATKHAEIVAIEKACQITKQWRLNNCEIYVTLEPCLMCAGALLAARIKRLVYACKDQKSGAVDSLYQTLSDTRLNHQVIVKSNVLSSESASLLKGFFQKKEPFA